MRRQSSTLGATMASMTFAGASGRCDMDCSIVSHTALRKKQRLDAVAIHVGARAAGYDLAALHDEVLVGERAREVVVLLDQQDRHLAGSGERADDVLDLLDDGGLDALGGLVEDEQARLHG